MVLAKRVLLQAIFPTCSAVVAPACRGPSLHHRSGQQFFLLSPSSCDLSVLAGLAEAAANPSTQQRGFSSPAQAEKAFGAPTTAAPKREFSNQPENAVYGGPSSPSPKRVTLRTLRGMYDRKEPISMVTAYDYPSAVHVGRCTPCCTCRRMHRGGCMLHRRI